MEAVKPLVSLVSEAYVDVFSARLDPKFVWARKTFASAKVTRGTARAFPASAASWLA